MKIAFLLMLVLAVSIVMAGQVTSETVHGKLGNPTTELFRVGPDISVTVTYGAGQEACTITVQTDKPTKYKDREETSQKLHSFLDKLVSVDMLGAKGDFDAITITGCSGIRYVKYQNGDVTETVFGGSNASCATEMQLVVSFNSGTCTKIQAIGR